ncbi:MAG: amidohydrolase [Clostridiaceae bacterium]
MKTILKNGKIYVEKDNFQEAILVEDGTIGQVGSNNEILKYDADRIIDLNGKTVLPGFNDSHLHLSLVGESMNSFDLTSARSIEEIVERGRAFLEKHRDVRAIYARGWNQDYFISGEKRMLERSDLDKISAEIPVALERVCTHVVVGNTKAIEVLGIDENSVVEGGEIEIGNDGKPNGIFKENAVRLIKSAMPEKDKSEIEKEFLLAANYALSLGVTSVQSCDIMSNDSKKMFAAIHEIYDQKKVKLRYRHQFNFKDIDDFKEYLETEYKTGKYDERFLSRGSLKLFKDGSLGARTAYLSRDYEDASGTRGVEALSDSQLQAFCDIAMEHGIQVLVHAIGDGAVESVINAFEKTIKDGQNPLRHGIVHCQITNAEQLKRIAKLDISVFYQPIFLDYDIKIAEARVGKKLADTSYAFNTLNRLGTPISFGTDSPVEDCNPFPNIYCAVTRQRMDGTPEGGFFPDERMSVGDAVDAYTSGSAFAEFKEGFKGRLKPGYVADLIVLDRDIFTIDKNEIKDIKVEKTMVDGEFAYEVQ